VQTAPGQGGLSNQQLGFTAEAASGSVLFVALNIVCTTRDDRFQRSRNCSLDVFNSEENEMPDFEDFFRRNNLLTDRVREAAEYLVANGVEDVDYLVGAPPSVRVTRGGRDEQKARQLERALN